MTKVSLSIAAAAVALASILAISPTASCADENGTVPTGTLRNVAGIDMVAPFGASLHVSGRDADALDAAIAPLRSDPRLTWTLSRPSLEDVFIAMMAKAQDNFP